MDIKELPKYFAIEKNNEYEFYQSINKNYVSSVCPIVTIPPFTVSLYNPSNTTINIAFIRKWNGQINRSCSWKLTGKYIKIDNIVFLVIQIFNCEEYILPPNLLFK
jgi:hypothetical protein